MNLLDIVVHPLWFLLLIVTAVLIAVCLRK